MSLITFVTRIHFADRAVEDVLGEEIQTLRLFRPLIMIDGVGGDEDAVERLCDALPTGCAPTLCPVAAGVARTEDAMRAVSFFNHAGCDGVIGLGGRAALDLARLISLIGGLTGSLDGLFEEDRLQGMTRQRRCPVVVIPTTTENGAGLCPTVVMARSDRQRHTLAGDGLVPSLVICDPTLGPGGGRDLAASSGMDVLAHCIEAYLGTAFNPPADGIALEGLRIAGAALERAIADASDGEARREMMAATICAGLAAQKGLGGVHALAHALEEVSADATPHGRMHAALLPQILAFNAPAVGNRYGAIRDCLRLAPETDLAGWCTGLGERLALPTSLGSLALDGAARRRVARRAEAEPANRTNPRLATARDYLRLLDAAVAGAG